MTHIQVSSKLIICDSDISAELALESFCEKNDLIPLCTSDPITLPMVLDSNIGIGGIILAADFGCDHDTWVQVAEQIKRKRPELPIFFRLLEDSEPEQLPEIANSFAGLFYLESLPQLKLLIDTYIHTTWYPKKLIERTQSITINALQHQFCNTEVNCDLYYLAHDQLTHGKLLSVIPIESNWCRGYMMLQAEKIPINHAIQAGRTQMQGTDSADGFSAANQVIGELTNLIWGAMKNELFFTEKLNTSRSQLPIIINYDLDHISFASKSPQLCFDYTVEHRDGLLPPFSIYQKFVFSLNWSPELFDETAQADKKAVETGHIEIFN